MVHEEPGGLVVQLRDQVANAHPHPRRGTIHIALAAARRLCRPTQQPVQVFTKALYPAEVMAADVASVRLRVPRQERPDAQIQRNDAGV